MSPSTASTSRIVPRWRSFAPAAMSSANVEKQMTMAVPMSGWARSSRQAAPTTMSSGRESSLTERRHLGRDASRPAE